MYLAFCSQGNTLFTQPRASFHHDYYNFEQRPRTFTFVVEGAGRDDNVWFCHFWLLLLLFVRTKDSLVN